MLAEGRPTSVCRANAGLPDQRPSAPSLPVTAGAAPKYLKAALSLRAAARAAQLIGGGSSPQPGTLIGLLRVPVSRGARLASRPRRQGLSRPGCWVPSMLSPFVRQQLCCGS